VHTRSAELYSVGLCAVAAAVVDMPWDTRDAVTVVVAAAAGGA